MKKLILSFFSFCLVVSLSGQERGTLIFQDSFDTQLTFAENWVIPKGHNHLFHSFDGQVVAGSGMIMRCDTPDDFWAEMDITFDSPKNPQGNSRAGFAVGKRYFTISPNGHFFGWRGKPIDGFQIGKPTRLTLIRKCSSKNALFVFMANGKELQRVSYPAERGEKSSLSTCCFGPTVRYDNFKLYALKEGDSSRNTIPNGGFEYELDGFPLAVGRGHSYIYANYQTIPYEKYLNTWSLDSTEKHSGKYSLKMVNDESCGRQNLWMHGAGAEENKPGVLSVWMKADQRNFPVTISYGGKSKEVKVDTTWKRYEVVNPKLGKPGYYSPVTLSFNKKKGTLWVDDMQAESLDDVPSEEDLKSGRTFASPYKPCPLGDSLSPKPKTYERPKSFSIPLLPAGIQPSTGLDAWSKYATEIDDFYNLGKKAKNDTRVFLACDQTNLFIGYRCRVKDASAVKVETCDRDSYKIFSNGGIEFFLDPEADGSFYQFAVNNGGSLFDAGKDGDVSWNGEWRSEVKVNPNENSVDYVVTIPFADLAGPSLKERWLVNLCRNDNETGENLTISKAVSPETKNSQTWAYAKLPASVVRKYALGADSGVYSEDDNGVCLSFDLENASGEKREISAEVIDISDGEKVVAKRDLVFEPGKKILSFSVKEKRDKVALRLSEKGKVVSEQVMTLEKQPTVSLLGRLNYYMEEPEARFRVKTILPNPEELTAVMSCGGKTIRQQCASSFEMSLPLKDIAVGTHVVDLALEKNGERIASVKSELIKRPFKAGATQINHFSRSLLVDGKPYIPFSPFVTTFNGHHPQSRKEYIESRIAFFHQYGFKTIDTLTDERNGDMSTGIQAFLRAVEAKDMKVMMWLGYWGKKGAIKSDEEIDRILEITASPNIITQRVMDEPEIQGVTSEKARELLLKMRPKFPYQPTYMNNTCVFVGGNYADRETDILMIDDYLTNQYNRSVRSVVIQADGMWKMGIEKGKPVFFFLVGCSFPYHYREPSYAEQIAQTYGNITAGCSGFTYFCGEFETPGNWKAIMQLNRELLSLSDVICSEEETEPAAATGDARYMRHITKKHNGDMYVISCNIDAYPADKVEFTLPTGLKYADEAEVLFEDRKIPVKDGKFTDDFPGHQRHVYKIKLKQ